jgi:hypothetical protein
LPYELDYLFSFSAQLHPPEVIGPVAEGIRANFYVASGEVSGPRVNGIVRRVGGDWLIVRNDGVGMLDVRPIVETHDSALLYLVYSGVADLGAEGYHAFARGELPPKISVQAAMRVQTAHPAYQWLNRLQCLNIGEVDSARLAVRYDVYAVQ